MIRVIIEHVPPSEEYETYATYVLTRGVPKAGLPPGVELDPGRVQRRYPPRDSSAWGGWDGQGEPFDPAHAIPGKAWTTEEFLAPEGELMAAIREAIEQDWALSEEGAATV